MLTVKSPSSKPPGSRKRMASDFFLSQPLTGWVGWAQWHFFGLKTSGGVLSLNYLMKLWNLDYNSG